MGSFPLDSLLGNALNFYCAYGCDTSRRYRADTNDLPSQAKESQSPCP